MSSTRATDPPFQHPATQRRAVRLAMWLFLANEVMLFGGLFLAYFVYRNAYAAVFTEASTHLHLWLGVGNTALLLTSSLTAALAMYAGAKDRLRVAAAWLAITAVQGVGFLLIKGLEYSELAHAGLLPLGSAALQWPGEQADIAELFFNLYLSMTGLHALHVLIGIVWLAALALILTRATVAEAARRRLEVATLYWHLVDLIWIFLLPTLYLIDR